MNALCRRALGILVLAVLLGATAAVQAQVLKQLPADPWVVIKFNNPQNISTKFAAMAQKLGLANLDPAFSDPLGALKKQLNIQAGVDDKGELAVAIYAPAENETDPRVLAFIPVTDYAAFLKPLPNLKTEGDISTFSLPDEEGEAYAVNRGSYAVLAVDKEMLAQKPAGVEVGGLAARQLAGNDVTAFVNIKALGAKALPELQANRNDIVQGIDNELAAGDPLQQKFAPAIKAMVNQVLNLAEHTLKEGQAATLGLTLVDQGLNITSTAEFDPSSYLGQTISSIKNSGNASFLAGLPNRQYFVYAAAALDPQVTRKILDDIVPPVRKELENVPEAKGVVAMIDAARNTLESIKTLSTGWVVPAEGQKSLVQQVAVYTGDAKKLQEAQRSYFQALTDLAKLAPQGPEVQSQIKPDAVTLDGTKLDQVNVQ
ncbi:MAG TPA: hypothetical protein VHP11_03105, partial [Tepidisphaeraceae bacterium]|nr:hypothetical protein [Tepidisphaeraceae bacterium]